MHDDNLNIITKTPVMSGRRINNMIPESPFLMSTNGHLNKVSTP